MKKLILLTSILITNQGLSAGWWGWDKLKNIAPENIIGGLFSEKIKLLQKKMDAGNLFFLIKKPKGGIAIVQESNKQFKEYNLTDFEYTKVHDNFNGTQAKVFIYREQDLFLPQIAEAVKSGPVEIILNIPTKKLIIGTEQFSIADAKTAQAFALLLPYLKQANRSLKYSIVRK